MRRIYVRPSVKESDVKAIFAGKEITTCLAKTSQTGKVSQGSLINLRVAEGKGVEQIANELINLGLFPSNPTKFEGLSEKAIHSKCIARINNHLLYLQGKQNRGASQPLQNKKTVLASQARTLMLAKKINVTTTTATK